MIIKKNFFSSSPGFKKTSKNALVPPSVSAPDSDAVGKKKLILGMTVGDISLFNRHFILPPHLNLSLSLSLSHST